MKNKPPYMPILLWKLAEKGALSDLSLEERKVIKPLIKLLPKANTSSKTILMEALSYIQKNFSDLTLFLDADFLYTQEKNEALTIINNTSGLFGSNIIPVFTLKDIEIATFGNDTNSFLQTQGICLRVNKADFSDDFFDQIDLQLQQIGLDRSQVDLLIDYEITDSSCLDNVVNKIEKDAKIALWRSFYFASGAFRENLVGLDPGSYDEERSDWLLWLSLSEKLQDIREIGFADYTIQHPIYVPVNNPNTSFSVRYAKEEKWVLMKGQARNAKNNAGDMQYFAHAQMIADTDLFCGETCCKGDVYILALSKDSSRTKGNPTTWLRIGINHHIALTIRQLASLN